MNKIYWVAGHRQLLKNVMNHRISFDWLVFVGVVKIYILFS